MPPTNAQRSEAPPSTTSTRRIRGVSSARRTVAVVFEDFQCEHLPIESTDPTKIAKDRCQRNGVEVSVTQIGGRERPR